MTIPDEHDEATVVLARLITWLGGQQGWKDAFLKQYPDARALLERVRKDEPT